MTWVVGATTPFGYGVMVSDICVSFKDGTQRDMLRKVHPVGRSMLAGFAGSLAIGFDMIDELRSTLANEGHCEPESAAAKFAQVARTIFDGHDPAEKKNGCDLMFVGVQPDARCLGDGTSVVGVLRCPRFEPDVARGMRKIMSIGCGAKQHEAMNALAASVSDLETMKAELGNPGGFGHSFAFGMARDLFFGAPPHVSRHMHISMSWATRQSIAPNDIEYIPPDGERVKLRMPDVANSRDELTRLLGSAEAMRGLTASQTKVGAPCS